MIKLENYEVVGWEHAIRGMRNPKNSWNLSDSEYQPCAFGNPAKIGPNDHKLMMQLAKGGPVHAKYRRMIVVYVDITAPLFWWKEFDTYKVGTVRNSCSTMHKIHVAPFRIDNFSHEGCDAVPEAKMVLETLVNTLEYLRVMFNETQDKKYWRALIELLPDSYNMKATVMLSYEVLANMHHWRKQIPHKLDEWLKFGDWIESLPYSEIITGYDSKEEES
jgi:hypothetical protein